jgi:hypothetical protein
VDLTGQLVLSSNYGIFQRGYVQSKVFINKNYSMMFPNFEPASQQCQLGGNGLYFYAFTRHGGIILEVKPGDSRLLGNSLSVQPKHFSTEPEFLNICCRLKSGREKLSVSKVKEYSSLCVLTENFFRNTYKPRIFTSRFILVFRVEYL